MTRPVVASIDLLALRQNLQIVRRAAPGSRLWAVVKANAYGHGVARVWSALSAMSRVAFSYCLAVRNSCSVPPWRPSY